MRSRDRRPSVHRLIASRTPLPACAPLGRRRTYYFAETLAPGAEMTVTFTMIATKPGVWTGEFVSCTPIENFASANVLI
jgi:hypothetical protein